MRQVMPHRNNIGPDCRSCKPFLHSKGNCPVNWRRCCILAKSRARGCKAKYMFFYNNIERSF
jgi:hypothetical protein